VQQNKLSSALQMMLIDIVLLSLITEGVKWTRAGCAASAPVTWEARQVDTD